MLKVQYIGYLMKRADSLEKPLMLKEIESRRRRGQKRILLERIETNNLERIFDKDYNGEGNGTPLQYSCLENLMDRGAWKAAVHGVAKSRA